MDPVAHPARPAPELSPAQKRHLRGLAHALKPVVRLGQAGLSEAVVRETDRALQDHELVKVEAAGGGRAARDAALAPLAAATAAALVQQIGNVAVLYRPRPQLPQ